MLRVLIKYMHHRKNSRLYNINTLDFGNKTCLQLVAERRLDAELAVYLIKFVPVVGMTLDYLLEKEHVWVSLHCQSLKTKVKQMKRPLRLSRYGELLHRRYLTTLKPKTECDLVFVVENKEIRTHSSILISKCEYFSVINLSLL